MATTDILARDRERYAQARARGRGRTEDASAVVSARYDSEADAIELRFGGGGSMSTCDINEDVTQLPCSAIRLGRRIAHGAPISQ